MIFGRFWQVLHVFPNPSETLVARKFVVLAFWVSGPKVALRTRTLAVVSMDRSCAASAKFRAIVSGGLDDSKLRNSRISLAEEEY